MSQSPRIQSSVFGRRFSKQLNGPVMETSQRKLAFELAFELVFELVRPEVFSGRAHPIRARAELGKTFERLQTRMTTRQGWRAGDMTRVMDIGKLGFDETCCEDLAQPIRIGTLVLRPRLLISI